MDVEVIDYVSHHWSGCADGNSIGAFDQLDDRRLCWKVGQIEIDERWRQNSSLYHSCSHLSAIRFLLPNMNFGSSVLHIFAEPSTDCCRYVCVVDTIEQFLLVHIVECGCQIECDMYCSLSRLFLDRTVAMSAVIVDNAVHVECFGQNPC